MEFLIFLIAYVINGLIFGFVASYISTSKGYTDGFAWGFWLGLLGVLVVGFRPTVTQTSAYSEQKSMHPESNSSSNARWECICGATNPDSMQYCLSCRRDRIDSKPKVNCPHCGAVNSVTNELCFACNKPIRSSDERPAKESNANDNATELASILETLAQLHEQGILTDDEFRQKKAEVLARM